MTSAGKGSRRADGWLPAIAIIAPYFLNKFVYIAAPDYRVFLATDYAVRLFSLTALYLLLKGRQRALPIPWRLATPSARDLMLALAGTLVLIAFNFIGRSWIEFLNALSWRLSRFPSPPGGFLKLFDDTVGMVLVGLSEEAVFRFYLMNFLLMRGASRALTVLISSLVFGAIHWSYGAGAMAFAAFAGLALAIVYLASRNLVAPVIAHAAYDAAYFSGGLALLSRTFG